MKLRQIDHYLQSINKQIKNGKRKEKTEASASAQERIDSAESAESLMHSGEFNWSGSCAVDRRRVTARTEVEQRQQKQKQKQKQKEAPSVEAKLTTQTSASAHAYQRTSAQIQLFITSIVFALILHGVGGDKSASARLAHPRAVGAQSGHRWPLHLQPSEDPQPAGKWSFQARLAQLRRELDAELSAGDGRQSALGSPCLANSDCARGIANAHCQIHNFTCACLPNHIQHNSTTCLPTSLLGYECLVDAQCERRVANSRCLGGKCACSAKFDTYRKDKCLPASKLDDYCLSNRQCQLADRHAFCKWKIQNVYGLCKCPPNYKRIGAQKIAGSNSSADLTNETQTSRCAPRLGDACIDHADCLLATPNSVCRAPSRSDSLAASWPTSSASPKRCLCAREFAHSADRLSCPKAASASGEHEVALEVAAQMDGKTQYELVMEANTKQSEQVGSLSSRTDEQQSGQSGQSGHSDHSGQSEAGSKRRVSVSVSSLGKVCESHNDCRARDAHSLCVSGRCECAKPSQRCSSNSTGCHKDTFQCRSGQCISWYFVCDQFKNCDDGSDEDQCQSSGRSANFRCPPEAFECANGFQCVSRARLCNGKRDCSDASDERACPSSALDAAAGACHPQAFKCQNGQCLPPFVFCNAVQDCADGSDESEALCGRPNATIAATGADSLLAKTDRSTIDKMLASLAGKRPATRARHSRLDWPPAGAAGARECPKWAFTCRDGRCRSGAILCSGVDGCGDNSDEDKCEVCRCEAP